MIPNTEAALALIRHLTATCGEWVRPLAVAEADGTLRLVPLHRDVAPKLEELNTFHLPAVAILPVPVGQPQDCAAVPALRRWVQMAVVMTTVPSEQELEMVVTVALTVGNVVLVGATPENAGAWSRAFLPQAAGLVLGVGR